MQDNLVVHPSPGEHSDTEAAVADHCVRYDTPTHSAERIRPILFNKSIPDLPRDHSSHAVIIVKKRLRHVVHGYSFSALPPIRIWYNSKYTIPSCSP